jgi:acyl carrier protein
MTKGSTMQSDLSAAVRKFISDNFLFREGLEAIADDASFLDAGIIDSTGVLELVSYLEDTWGVTVADEEMLPENFDSIRGIVAYLQRKRAAPPLPGGICAALAGT